MKRAILMSLGAVALAVTGTSAAVSANTATGMQLRGLARSLTPKVKLPNLFKGEPPVSTNIKDAVYGDPSQDNFNPGTPGSLTSLPRDEDGGFVLAPGYYSMTAQTYCLKAGTHGPTGGDGYLYAPMKGSQREAVESILRNSVDHPDIAQRDIQVLLWAIVARAKFEDLNNKHKVIATRLLTTKQLSKLNRNALDVITNRQFQSLVGGVPAPVASVLRAEADMRRMLSGGSTYSQLEQVAVLSGVAPIGEGSVDVPAIRWSKHPDGYWVRYDPQGYSRTKVEIFVAVGSDGVGETYDPAKSVAVPGNTAKQRIGQSERVYGQ